MLLPLRRLALGLHCSPPPLRLVTCSTLHSSLFRCQARISFGNEIFVRRPFSSTYSAQIRRWTPEDDDVLLSMVKQGIDDEHIGRELGRSSMAIGIRRSRLSSRSEGYLRPSFHRSWTQAEHDRAFALREEKYSISAIASVLGRSYNSVTSRLKHIPQDIEIAARRRGRGNLVQKFVKQIAEMRAQGASWQSIQAALPQPFDIRVMHQAHRRYLDFLELEKDKTVKYARPWTVEESELLLHLKRDCGMSFAEIKERIPGRSRMALSLRYKGLKGPRQLDWTLTELKTVAEMRTKSCTWRQIAGSLGRTESNTESTFRGILKGGFVVDADGSIKWTKDWLALHARRFPEFQEKGGEQDMSAHATSTSTNPNP